MGTQNNGNQVFTFDYKQAGTSQGFNKLVHEVLPIGVLKGGELARVTDTTVTLTPMIAMFEDKKNGVTVRIETTEQASIGVSTSAPYVVAKFRWLNIEDNYVDFVASEYSESLAEEGLIIGKCLYKSNVLVGFDYSRKSWSQDHFWNKNYLDFRVVPNEPEDTSIKVEKGSAIIGGKKVDFKGGIKTINTNVSLQRIDLVSINKNGEIIITEGIQNEKPEIPVFPNDMLTVGIIRLPSNPQTIRGDMIESLYNVNYNQPSADLNLAQIISKDTSIVNVQEDTKYIIEGLTKSLTLDSATYKGCIVQVYANIDNSKLILKHPNKIYKLTKGEYVHLIWNGIDWVDIGQTTTWDLRNTPYSIPSGANLNEYIRAGTWKNDKIIGINEMPEELIQVEEANPDRKTYCTIIVEEGDTWVKQYIRYANTKTDGNNGSGHYLLIRGGLKGPDNSIQSWTGWSRNASFDELTRVENYIYSNKKIKYAKRPRSSEFNYNYKKWLEYGTYGFKDKWQVENLSELQEGDTVLLKGVVQDKPELVANVVARVISTSGLNLIYAISYNVIFTPFVKDISDDAVTTSKIKDSNVTESKLASNSVTTTKIKDSNVTTAKIADGNVTTNKLEKSVQTTLTNAVPNSRKINTHPLTSDITLTKGDVGLGNVSNKTDAQFWEYNKGQISSVLGLTKSNYGGKSATAGVSDSSTYSETSGTLKDFAEGGTTWGLTWKGDMGIPNPTYLVGYDVNMAKLRPVDKYTLIPKTVYLRQMDPTEGISGHKYTWDITPPSNGTWLASAHIYITNETLGASITLSAKYITTHSMTVRQPVIAGANIVDCNISNIMTLNQTNPAELTIYCHGVYNPTISWYVNLVKISDSELTQYIK